MMPDRVQELAAMERRKDGPKLGQDGQIPGRYHSAVRIAIETAWRLNTDPAFVEVFRDTLAKLTGKPQTLGIYAAALNKMVLNCADGARTPRIVLALKADQDARRKDPTYQIAPAYSFVNESNIWIWEWQLAKGDRAIAGSIMHEAAHLVGAPTNMLAEMALDRIHKAAGIPR